MPETIQDMIIERRPTADRPLLGQTVLVVEDSRLTCEAMRLLCLHSGARIRRADSLRAAARHLAVYRPTIAVIDLGLPDGSGLDLVHDLSRTQPRVPVILAISGDETMRATALAAGANDFLSKPLTSLAVFQSSVLAHLPADKRPDGLREVPKDQVVPDAIAYHDDLAQVAELLEARPDASDLRYIAQFLGGLATSVADPILGDAAERLSVMAAKGKETEAIAFISDVITERLPPVRAL